jgi:hypothetical protein
MCDGRATVLSGDGEPDRTIAVSKSSGVLSCFDLVMIGGIFPSVNHANATVLDSRAVQLFDAIIPGVDSCARWSVSLLKGIG